MDEKDGVSAYMSHVASLEPLPEEKCANVERVVTRRGLQCVVALVLFLILLSMIYGSSKADFKFAHRVTLWGPS